LFGENKMAVIYNKCDSEVTKVLNEVLSMEYPQLLEAGVTFNCVFAEKYDKDTGEAVTSLKVHGFPAAAKIQVSTLVERSRGMEDVKVTIDRMEWVKANDESKRAIIDHELLHLVLQDSEDDLGRPKIKLQPHDLVVGGFSTIIKRYGEKCLDFQQIDTVNSTVKEVL
jgi:hypothetical protein